MNFPLKLQCHFPPLGFPCALQISILAIFSG